MKKVHLAIGAGLLAMLAGGHAARAETVDKIVAVVNDDPITLYQLDKEMADKIDEIKKAEGNNLQKEKFNDYRQQALNLLIEEKLLDQEMTKHNMTVTDADVQKSIDSVMKRTSLTKQQLIEEVQKKGITFEKYQADLKGQIRKMKFMGEFLAPRVKVTDADLDAFFAKHPDQFAPYQSVEMAQIILPLSETASDSEISTANTQAKEIINKAKGGGNFEDLGKKYSQTPSTAVKAIYQSNMLAPQIVEALTDMKPGDVSQPVRSPLGLHIVKLYERKTLAGDEYKAVREQLREKVFEEKLEEELQKYVDELKTKSYIQTKSST